MQNQIVLSNDAIRKAAPSVFATEPWDQVSERYVFIPTIEVVNQLRANGFQPVRASQSKSRIEGKGEFTKHMLRFRREHDILTQLGDELPEIVLVNSHDRTSSYQLSAGVFRLACLNGMVVKSADFGSIKVQHSGNIVDNVLEGSYRIIEEVPAIMERVQAYKGIVLDDEEQRVFASAAMELRYPTPLDEETGEPLPNYAAPFVAANLLTVRRTVDAKRDLWTISNRVQEAFMRGGIRSLAASGRRSKTRSINSVSEELRLNKALWQLTERMAQLKV
ncbi:MAG: hypothetical protein A2W25_15340 [candidate division Zixibacteria bacterium RBG_16_53_22]|nr:MAG: hypothetical protein A2W25_15340 [candidate division Zixibacteria bacterium RBG_16_53_22]